MQLEQRLKIIGSLFLSVFALLWVRLFYLQVMQGSTLRRLAEANRTSIVFERAPRGLILDRRGQILADCRPSFVVLFAGLDVHCKVLPPQIARRLSSILSIPEENLNACLERAFGRGSMVRLADRISKAQAFALAEQRAFLPGISVMTEMQRYYPQGFLAAHVLGYMGQMSPAEFLKYRAKRYQRDWFLGKTGIEKIYDPQLQGQAGGMRLEVDASGRSVKVLDKKEPVAGSTLRTTIDSDLQHVAQTALQDSGKAGAIVVLDPYSGEILAMVSNPAFDPNAFLSRQQQKLEQGQATALRSVDFLNDPMRPLFNRAVCGTYAPGSIFKIVVGAALLESGKIDPEERVYCTGSFLIPSKENKRVSCWKKDAHGAVNFVQALQNSCNVYFYQNGLRVGPDAIENMARAFGLGQRTSLQFQNEKRGFVPGRSIFKTNRRRWYDGDTVNFSIGQGRMLLTPLQAAQMTAIMASRGKRPQLRLLRSIGGVAISSAAAQPDLKLSNRTWDYLNRGLLAVFESGTAKASQVAGLKVAGKTGTVQNPQGKDHAWAVCYAPANHPKIAMAVMVEHGEKGGMAAAPIAKKILEHYFKKLPKASDLGSL